MISQKFNHIDIFIIQVNKVCNNAIMAIFGNKINPDFIEVL
jgi:hypothetical protein